MTITMLKEFLDMFEKDFGHLKDLTILELHVYGNGINVRYENKSDSGFIVNNQLYKSL